jgi:hypothetical protein
MQSYAVEEVMLDLLHNAARVLVVGGYLAYLIPTPYTFVETDLPVHPCLEMVLLCKQPLTGRHARHCVVLRKTRPYSAELEKQYADYTALVLSGGDMDGFGGLKGKLEAALSRTAFDNDEVIKIYSPHNLKRKEGKAKRRMQEKAAKRQAKLAGGGASTQADKADSREDQSEDLGEEDKIIKEEES